MLAKMMLAGPNVILLDGPTAHLDLESISAVNEGVARFKGVAVFATHDHEFIQTSANRLIEIDGTLIDDQEMSYDDYLERRRLH